MTSPAPPIGDRHALISSPLGELTVIARDYRLAGLYYDDHTHRPDAARFGQRVEASADPFLAEVAHQLEGYFAGTLTHFDLPLYLPGTTFRTRVWELLRHIPYGEHRSYAQLAALAGIPAAAQSIGQAVGANPISIIVPCHRVLGADGSLTGYAGGTARKQALLDLEAPTDLTASRLF
ncbi:methylated-DNA--[protein]-cysteine S-methyltransferase [Bowdeniella massiliensis]|uniref:methylated-DNA--[protein]-cysteine S-methyltransferase n=1 Tax=Bowdeniella massiliensis TaxID=2932264 RepID=UPI002541CE91|nr:methylated-DNA--[protein]-cysteine S-methyltransferase [Bowdeniella massiliensis]